MRIQIFLTPIVQGLWVHSQSFVDVTHAFMYHSVLTFEAGVDFFFKAKFWGSFFSEYCSSIDLLYFVKKVFNRYPFISVSVSFVADSLVFQLFSSLFFLPGQNGQKVPLLGSLLPNSSDVSPIFFTNFLSVGSRKKNIWSKTSLFSVCQSKIL